MAFQVHGELLPAGPGRRPEDGVQHRRVLHPRSQLAKLPATQPQARPTRLRLPQVCSPQDDGSEGVHQGRLNLHQDPRGSQQKRGRLEHAA